MVEAKLKYGDMNEEWAPVKYIRWENGVVGVHECFKSAWFRAKQGYIHSVFPRAGIYLKKINNNIHLEVINLRKRYVFVNPKFIDVYKIFNEFPPSIEINLFSKLYLFFGDLTNSYQKIDELKKAISTGNIDKIKELIEEAKKIGNALEESLNG